MRRKTIIINSILLLAINCNAQFPSISTTKSGLLIGVQRGKFNGFEIGFEKQWKQVKLVKPKTFGISATGEYLFNSNSLGFKAGPWIKFGRTKFTYGANVLAAAKFNKSQMAFAPTIGIKLLGFHALASYNFFRNSQEFDYNKFNVSVRYFISRKRKFDVHKKKDVQWL
jgi:hypothetical protein